MIFEEEGYRKLSEKDILWKYLDFHKFIDLISNKTLHFTRLDQFEDPFEGATRKAIFDINLAKASPTNPALEDAFGKGFLEHEKTKQKNIISKNKKEIEASQKSQFVDCWVKRDRESMAMWDLYSNPESLAIFINGKNFIKNLQDLIKTQEEILPKHYFFVGSIFYDKINPPAYFDKIDKPNRLNSFKKDICFSHEEEYRLVISSPKDMIEENPTFHKLNLYDTFLEDIVIVCHPKMQKWQFKNIECLCKKFHINPPQKSDIELNF